MTRYSGHIFAQICYFQVPLTHAHQSILHVMTNAEYRMLTVCQYYSVSRFGINNYEVRMANYCKQLFFFKVYIIYAVS